MKLNVPFYRQTTPLNCGQTALKMALSFFGQDVSIEELEKLSFLEKEKGTNTIQLVVAASSFGNKTEFYTNHLQFNEENQKLNFVRKYSSVDEKEMEKLIFLSKSKGAKLYEKTISLKELKRKTTENSIPVVLLDWNVITGRKEKGYQGHFVPVIGYDEECVFILNPDDEKGTVLRIKNELFDEARKAKGTDEDIIILYRKD